MHVCQRCGKSYPSKYYFVTAETCNECFEKLDDKTQEQILVGVREVGSEGAVVREVDGHRLKCPVCGHAQFWSRRTLMNTPGMTFFGIEWANQQAQNYICDSCGYVMWFLR